ncbi:hypothetical protein EYF80_032270 [Liparis tanakae]|uniref:Uncharacterized protein n=1 Tax=Liparis tanakae TaxID=230148 RepID=A0A4Z2GVJ0_9TELE|nr:hypothetical protein EYF80_032270 [Liparis tanakae]
MMLSNICSVIARIRDGHNIRQWQVDIAAPAPEGEVGHFESGLGRVQVHHPHHPLEEVTGGVQHGPSKQRYTCCVADQKEGDNSLEVEDEHRGQDDHGERRLEQFQSGHRSEELHNSLLAKMTGTPLTRMYLTEPLVSRFPLTGSRFLRALESCRSMCRIELSVQRGSVL